MGSRLDSARVDAEERARSRISSCGTRRSMPWMDTRCSGGGCADITATRRTSTRITSRRRRRRSRRHPTDSVPSEFDAWLASQRERGAMRMTSTHFRAWSRSSRRRRYRRSRQGVTSSRPSRDPANHVQVHFRSRSRNFHRLLLRLRRCEEARRERRRRASSTASAGAIAASTTTDIDKQMEAPRALTPSADEGAGCSARRLGCARTRDAASSRWNGVPRRLYE